MALRVDHAVTSGTFSLDGQTFDVDNNVWVVGDDAECVVIDAPHSVDDILAVVGDRKVKAIICTHAHDDHVRVAPALREATVAPILLHPDDRPLWELTHTDYLWDVDLTDDQTITVAGEEIRVLHTPGHAPGAVCLSVPSLGCVFTGDTLFEGGPGATGRSYSDADLIKESIRARLFALPDDTVVHTGHGPDTTIGAERANLDAGVHRRRRRIVPAQRVGGESSVSLRDRDREPECGRWAAGLAARRTYLRGHRADQPATSSSVAVQRRHFDGPQHRLRRRRATRASRRTAGVSPTSRRQPASLRDHDEVRRPSRSTSNPATSEPSVPRVMSPRVSS